MSDEHTSSEPIKVWRFEQAPAELKALSCNGGDEDWIAVVPKDFPWRDHVIWLESGSSFGCCEVEVHELPDGSTVHIGCHS